MMGLEDRKVLGREKNLDMREQHLGRQEQGSQEQGRQEQGSQEQGRKGQGSQEQGS
jgi:hypothetical protein